MNCSAVREAPTKPPVQSIVLVLSVKEAVELQRTITSVNISPIKDKIYDVLSQTFRTEEIGGGLYV